MKILQSRPDTAKINGEPVKGNLLKIKKSVIRVDRFLKVRLEKKKVSVEKIRKETQKKNRLSSENRIESKGRFKNILPDKGIKVPGMSFLDSFKSFIAKLVLGFFVIKLIPFLPKLKGIVIGLNNFANFIINFGGAILNGLVSFVDFGVRAGDATIGFIKNIGGEKTAEVFSAFGGALSGLIDAAILIGTLTLAESFSGGGGGFDFFNRGKTKTKIKTNTNIKNPSNNIRPFNSKGNSKLNTKNIKTKGINTKGIRMPKALRSLTKAKGAGFLGLLLLLPTLFEVGGLASQGFGKTAINVTISTIAGIAAGALAAKGVLAGAAALGITGVGLPAAIALAATSIVASGLAGWAAYETSYNLLKAFGLRDDPEKLREAGFEGYKEGGMVESDRFKQDEQLTLPPKNISGIQFSEVAKKVFPDDIEYLPKSGEVIKKSFSSVTNGVLGPVLGIAFKMLAGQTITNDDAKVASDYLKVGSKLGFNPEDIKKGLNIKSSSIKDEVEAEESQVEEIAGPEAGYPLTKFLLNLSKTKDPKSGGVQLFYKNEVDSIRNMLETIFKIAAALGIITAAVAAFTVGLPALVGVLTKIAAPVVTSAPTLIARIFQSAAPAATKLARGVSQGVTTGVRQATARGAKQVGMTNVGRVAKDQVVDTTARTIIKKPLRFEQQVLDLTTKKPTIPTGQLSLSKKILQPKAFAKSVKQASTSRPATNIEKTFDKLTTVRPTRSGMVERIPNPRQTNVKLDIKSDIPDPFSTGPIRKGIDVLDIFKKPIIKKPLGQGGVTSPKQLNLSRKVLDPKRFSREAAKASKQQKLIRDKANKALRESDVGDDLLRSVEADPKLRGVRSAVERETGSIIRSEPASTLTRSEIREISQAAESSNVLQKIVEILKRKGAVDTNAATNINPITKTLRKKGLGTGQTPQNIDLGTSVPSGTTAKSINGTIRFFDLKGKQITDPKILDNLRKLLEQSPIKKAKGGFIQGAGGTDMIPARLTSGEFVIDKDSTDYLRATMPGFLAGINKAKYDDVLPVLQSYASYESGFGGQDIVVVAPTTEINNISVQQSSRPSMVPAGGSGEDPFEVLAKG